MNSGLIRAKVEHGAWGVESGELGMGSRILNIHLGNHRRSIETEAKANCRCFILGGKIECRAGNFWLECEALCT